jgi:hypothetical protein
MFKHISSEVKLNPEEWIAAHYKNLKEELESQKKEIQNTNDHTSIT